MTESAPLTLGTAGHIDHGKTALIRALTGVDTDRLPQERDRGISIELGYARLELPSGRRISIVDVPGHERFVRTMVAGATGIDLYLMTVAADDGVMPQTREHAAVLRALGVRSGVVAVTKSDLADPEIAMIEAAELLPGVEVVPLSARTGAGVEDLLGALDRVAASLPGRADTPGPARLHIDRVFTIRGAGTVVTGTLWSGSVGQGDEVRLLPSGLRARVRAVQVHDASVERAAAGQRVAVNLTGVALNDVHRGDVLASRDADLRPIYRLDTELEFGFGSSGAAAGNLGTGGAPDSGQRVQVHHGTRESPARLRRLGERAWQLRLERPLVAAPGDRLVIRQIAPPDTLGGGLVVAQAGGRPDVGISRAGERRRSPPTHAVLLPLTDSALQLERRLKEAGLEPPLDSDLDPQDLASLREHGRAIRVGKQLHYHPEALQRAREKVLAIAERNAGAVTLSQLRDELGTSRKFAQALLEHFDAEKLTIRRGDAHHVRASARSR